jgi:hypothetical protein
VCARKPEVLRQCMRKAEQAAREREAAEAREREAEQRRAAEQERASSDEMLAWGAEFWGAFGGGVAEGMAAAYAAIGAEIVAGGGAAAAAEEEEGVAADPEEGDPAELEAEVPQAAELAAEALGIDGVEWQELPADDGMFDDDDDVEDEFEEGEDILDGVLETDFLD